MGKPTRKQVEEELRSLIPDFDYCKVCGRPIWGLLSMAVGMGPTCAIAQHTRDLERQGRQRHEIRSMLERREAYRREMEEARSVATVTNITIERPAKVTYANMFAPEPVAPPVKRKR